MKAVFHGACRNCAFFYAVCHGNEFIEEFFHFLRVITSGRWGLPVGPGGERAFGFKVLDVFQSYIDLVRLLGMNDRTRSMRMVFWIQRLHRGADLCHTLKTRLKFWQSELFSVCPNKFSRESPNFHKCFFGSKRESQVCATCVYFSTTSVRPTQSMIYVPLLVNRFQNSGLLIVQYKYVKSFSEDFILQNLILCTRSCGTGFITEPN